MMGRFLFLVVEGSWSRGIIGLRRAGSIADMSDDRYWNE
jgi:hypothetical protein